MAFDMDIYGNCEGTFYCLANWANTITNGMFWTFALLAFGIVLYIATIRFGNTRAYGFASVSVGLGATFLTILTLMPFWIGTIFFVNAAISIVALLVSDR